MPSTPRFLVTQDADFVLVHVRVPFVRVSEMEFHVDGVHFTFYCKPYLLKLAFPHEVVDDEHAKAVYDPNKDNGTIVVHLPKKEPGQVFEDLDLLTTLLQPTQPKPRTVDSKPARPARPLIEVINSTNIEEATATDITEAKPADHSAVQRTCPRDSTLMSLEEPVQQGLDSNKDMPRLHISLEKPNYGFNNAYSDVFRCWHGEACEILPLPEPDETPSERRRVLREQDEDAQFDIERYLLDFAHAQDDEYFEMAMQYVPFWRKSQQNAAASSISIDSHVADAPTAQDASASVVPLGDALAHMTLQEQSVLSDADRELMLRLPNKEFLIANDSDAERVALGGLVDILIGFVYEHLTTQGDSGIESAWTISILSRTLAWLDSTGDIAAVVQTSVRRMLSFPLLRQFELARRTLVETSALLQCGKRVVLHALLELFRILEKSETHYLLNTIYVQDYCVWVQTLSDERLKRLGEQLGACAASFRKGDTGWALGEMEQALAGPDDEADGHDHEAESEASSESSNDDESESSSDESSESSDDDDGDDPSTKDAAAARTLETGTT